MLLSRIQQLLPIPTPIDVAKVLEPERNLHERHGRANHRLFHEIPGSRTNEVLEAGDDGRGHLERPPGGSQPLSGGQEARHPLSDLCPLRKSRAQHAGTLGLRRNADARRYVSVFPISETGIRNVGEKYRGSFFFLRQSTHGSP